ncbi:pyruvate, water dikinase regulatory protein [Thermopetrobacter sp. TC1]|uniref:pyruvate, water dikinase regulatory protein n=1 Tax=Thermopetrobacter sp. TC1 TaxID=1495045 RepID=UPI00056E8A75|nr:pyruvate, water dikinase regulatory protein [Thermopetrobacter sp. TC1]
MPRTASRFFHIHLVSDATGETLSRVSRAVIAHFAEHHAIEHMHSMVRDYKRLEEVIAAMEAEPGIVLYTLADERLMSRLENACKELGLPCVNILKPVIDAFSGYLNADRAPRTGAQHALNEDYFARIRALDYAMAHDDGSNPETLDQADVILVGLSRTSKTPTSIYLANRGIKAANVPFVSGVRLPDQLMKLKGRKGPLVVGLVANASMLADIRRKRMDLLTQQTAESYVDRREIAREINALKTLCARRGWPVIDVSRRSVEETAALILNLLEERARQERTHS